MKTLHLCKEKLLQGLKWSVVLLTLALVIDVLWGVITRYFFNEQSSWTEELSRFLLVWMVLLASALVYGHKEHLGLDYFVGNMDDKTQKYVAFVSKLVGLLFSILVLIYGGSRLVLHTFEMNQMMQALQIHKGWMYLSVPVSGVFFLIFCLESLLEKKESES